LQKEKKIFFINLVWPKVCGVYKVYSTVVYSNILGLHILLSLTHSLTHPQQLPVLQAPFMVSALYRCTIFYLVYRIFTLPLLCLDMFRYTNTYHCVTTAYSIQYSNMLYRFVAYEQ